MNANVEIAQRDLVENLAALDDLLRKLVDLSREKLAAMRKADSKQMHALTKREERLLVEVHACQSAREAIATRLAQSLNRPALRVASVSRLSEELKEPVASVLRARAISLRTRSEELQRTNGIVAHVAHAMHGHISEVFGSIARFMQEAVVYGPRGRHEAQRTRTMVDAIG